MIWNLRQAVGTIKASVLSIVFFMTLMLPLLQSRAVLASEDPKRVLLLFSDDQGVSFISTLSQSIRSTLNSKAEGRVEFYTEHLDRIRITDEIYERELVSFWQKKYEARKVDLIIVCIASAFDLLSRHRSELFPGAPVVFCLLFDPQASGIKTGSNATGVWSVSPFGPTLELILRLHPDTRRVMLVSGSGDFDRTVLEIAKAELRGFENEVEIIYLQDITISELQNRLASLPDHTIVIQLSFSQDKAGVIVDGPEILSKVASASTAPVYGVSSIILGRGIVGGSLVSTEDLGARSAEIGARILAGERPQDIAPQIVPNALMFDWREMRRWGISEKNLPPGSIVRFVVPSFWDEYQWRIISVISLLIVQFVLIVGLVINRVRRKQANERMRESEERFRVMADNAPVLIRISGPDRLGTYFNRQWLEFTGRTMEQELGNGWAEEVHPEDYQRCISAYFSAFEARRSFRIEYRLRHSDGEYRWVLDTGIPRLMPDGAFAGYICSAIDITERKQVEEMLHKIAQGDSASTSDDLLRTLARRSSEVLGVDFVFVGRVVGDNHDRVKTVVALMDGKIGENVEYDLADTPCESVMKLGMLCCASGVQSRFPRDRQLVEMGVESYLGMALRNSTGQSFGLVSMMGRAPIKNVETHESVLQIFASRAAAEMERDRAQEALQQSQSELAHVARVMIAGELAATIAHEVNQPLTAMVANANATRRMLSNGNANLDEVREAIEDIVKDAHRASQIVGRIRSLLRNDPHRTEALAINEVIEEVATIARNDLVGKRVRLRMELAEGLPPVGADRVEIQQVMLNLMMNAVQAMRCVENADRNLLIRTTREESGRVGVEVQDSGVGIAPENLERVFDAFYTTRKEGMGMGLSICRTIIEAHGGRLWAEANNDKGVTLRFTLQSFLESHP
jgi:two-component system sensor kinase FixL